MRGRQMRKADFRRALMEGPDPHETMGLSFLQNRSIHPKPDEASRLIAKMTNWQNHQWMRNGRPRSLKEIEKFLGLTKRTA